MRRIPFPGNPNGVRDNLVDANRRSSARRGHPDGILSASGPTRTRLEPRTGCAGTSRRGCARPPPSDELAYFVERLLVFVTSSDERRFGQWEHVSWWDFIEADNKSNAYKQVLAPGLTREVVAAKERGEHPTIGNMGEAFAYNIRSAGTTARRTGS